MLTTPIEAHAQVCAVEQFAEERLAFVDAASGQRVALATFPAVAVGGGRGTFEAAVVATMARVRTLRAAAQGPSQPTGAALKDVLGGVRKPMDRRKEEKDREEIGD